MGSIILGIYASDLHKLLFKIYLFVQGNIALADEYSLDDFAQPAGGCCFLTDPSYAAKLGDMWQHQGHKDYELDDIMLLKVGRHIRPNDRFKMIIGREEGENNFLQGYRKLFTHMKVKDYAGPLVLLDGEPQDDDLELAARIIGRFSQGKTAEQLKVGITEPGKEEIILTVKPMAASDIQQAWYI